MAILTRTICRLNIPTQLKILAIFHRYWKPICNFICNHKRPWIAETILREENNGGRLTIPGFNTYHIAIKIKSTWHWKKTDTPVNRIELNALSYVHILPVTNILKKKTKIYNGAKKASTTDVAKQTR